MSTEIAPRRVCSLCVVAILGQFALASTAVASACSRRSEGQRLGVGAYRRIHVDPSVAPAVNVTLAVGHRAMRILCGSHLSCKPPLPPVEADVRQDHLRRVITAQIGGLYGP